MQLSDRNETDIKPDNMSKKLLSLTTILQMEMQQKINGQW